MPRVIVLVTKNPHKKAEFEKQLSRYGHDVLVDYDSEHKEDLDFFVQKYLKYAAEQDKQDFVLVAVIRERMELLDSDGNIVRDNEIDELCHLLPVTNRSTLFYRSFRDHFEMNHQVSYSTKGYLDMHKRRNVDPNIFGWDDIFTDIRTHKTYCELQSGRSKSEYIDKISSRDHAIADFIEKVLYYAKKIDLFHKPQNFRSVVDFSKFEDVRKTVEDILNIQFDPEQSSSENSEHNQAYLRKTIQNLCHSVFNSGITFRSPENRRVKLSWMPGLNPGIPFTRKVKDSGQEATYMIHDFGHHAIPDLIYVKGNNIDIEKRRRNKRIYIIYRMMSEAITMVIADMFFVDGILGGNLNYADVESRRIYPLYQAILKANPDRIKTVEGLMTLCKEIIRANVTYVLSGKYERIQAHLGTSEEPPVLTNFRDKYESFFVEDYRWTTKNYEYFERIDMDRWYSAMNEFGLLQDMNLMTVDEFSVQVESRSKTFKEDISRPELDLMAVIDPIFDSIFDLWLSDLFHPDIRIELDDADVRLEKSFRRYMIGQLYLFHRMDGIDSDYNIVVFCKNIVERLRKFQKAGRVDLKSVIVLRKFYNLYLDQLREKGIITSDDVRVYSEVYPILEPFIVSYQEPGEGLRDRLETFSMDCLA